jgi:uncharacterized membrane protein YhiD involved in acid resistance
MAAYFRGFGERGVGMRTSMILCIISCLAVLGTTSVGAQTLPQVEPPSLPATASKDEVDFVAAVGFWETRAGPGNLDRTIGGFSA